MLLVQKLYAEIPELRLFVEMVAVGAMLVIVSFFLKAAKGTLCEVMQKPHVWKMALSLFTTGAVAHFLCEVAGINEWYAANYQPIF